MKVSQIKVLYSEEDVNEWLKLNYHLEVVNVSLAMEDFRRRFLIHYKTNAEITVDKNKQ